ncbi:MAG: 2-amino-4-hydroxy-6-hydroxymethyldihydropteridine diphosphokinase [Acidiferrobacterales bacterium]|nr:2-amino-4-hydroxy-6-hydroxymethyldihydropteridine diphosphokinase [Acidiferrobacterales bacterium]
MPRVFVSIGSNIDKEKNVAIAVRALDSYYRPLTVSSVYESPPFGFRGDNFYNLVVGFDTEELLTEVVARLTDIERICGRVRGDKTFDSRTLDMDLLLYGNLARHDKEVDVPRPEIGEHAFVLLPLAEIAPELKHPETGQTFKAMWESFSDGRQKLRPVPLDFGL